MSNCADQTWIDLLRLVLDTGHGASPRDMGTMELLGVQSEVDMTRPVVTNLKRDLGYRFLCAEAWWILTGRSDVASIAPYSNIIHKFSDNGIRFQGAYGPMITEQLQYVIDTLVKDPESRQAVLTIWRPNPRPSKDIPCTIAGQWIIRDHTLHYIHTMRSSDLWLGWPYDVFNFSMLSAYIALRLRETSRRFQGIKLGNMHFTAGSQHIYRPYYKRAYECIQHWQEHWLYEPLNIDEFETGEHLIGWLQALKDRQFELGAYRFLQELIKHG